MSLRTALLPVVDLIRGQIPGLLDLRQHQVSMLVRTWTGARPNTPGSTKTDVVTVLTNSGGYNPKVTQVTSKDIIASGGLYQAGDFKVGPLTNDYAGGGTTDVMIDPAVTTTAREVHFLITGPRLPSQGIWCHRINSDDYKNFHVNLYLRASGKSP